ncbi:uncharacterized protein LOC144421013 [Styela clava]
MEKVNKKVQLEFQSHVSELQKNQKAIGKCVKLRQQLEAQLTENTLVQKELDILESDATVYKLTGPVLVKQDLNEAKANVKKRVDYITEEFKRQEKTIEDLEKKQETTRQALMKIQASLPKPTGKQVA